MALHVKPLLQTFVAATFVMQGMAAGFWNLKWWNPDNWHGPPPVNPFSPAWPNTVAICSMMKDEHFDDIEEWLGYHRRIGVDKAFLFEDAPAIPPAMHQHLRPWIDIGFLHLEAINNTGLSYTSMQVVLHNRCSKPDMAGAYSWVMDIDLDEYLIILDEGKASTNPKLKEVLTAFRHNAGVVVQNVMFGSSGHVKRPSPGGPLRHYTHCNHWLGPMFKNIANTYWLEALAVHNAYYRYNGVDPLASPIVQANGAPVVTVVLDPIANKSELDDMMPKRSPEARFRRNEWGITTENNSGKITPELKLLLFHYVTRSQDDYFNRKFRLTQQEVKRGNHTFATSLFDDKAPIEQFDEKWFQEMQKKRYHVEGGICAEAYNANYADAAAQVVVQVRGLEDV